MPEGRAAADNPVCPQGKSEKEMRIFTSYFANLKKLPPEFVPISIALKTPDWFSGLRYPALAPTGEIFSAWKRHHNNNLYLEQYNREVLGRLNVFNVRRDIEQLSGGADAVLLCYECPADFCHRHRAAEWLSGCGIPVREWGEDERGEEWVQERLF